MYVCVYVCMYVCMHACMYVCMYTCDGKFWNFTMTFEIFWIHLWNPWICLELFGCISLSFTATTHCNSWRLHASHDVSCPRSPRRSCAAARCETASVCASCQADPNRQCQKKPTENAPIKTIWPYMQMLKWDFCHDHVRIFVSSGWSRTHAILITKISGTAKGPSCVMNCHNVMIMSIVDMMRGCHRPHCVMKCHEFSYCHDHVNCGYDEGLSQAP